MDEKQLEIAANLITNTFIWTYKKGDNIIYNLQILYELYDSRKKVSNHKKDLYNKPITLIIISIIECILDDFVTRIIQHRSDTVPNLTLRQIGGFKTKKLDKFDHYITHAKMHDLFDQSDRFYKILALLREVRNRIHIQNEKRRLAANEQEVFTNDILELSEKTFEVILERMVNKFPRSHANNKSLNINDFPYPWK